MNNHLTKENCETGVNKKFNLFKCSITKRDEISEEIEKAVNNRKKEKRHYSIVNYKKFETFAGKLDSQNDDNQYISDAINIIQNAKNFLNEKNNVLKQRSKKISISFLQKMPDSTMKNISVNNVESLKYDKHFAENILPDNVFKKHSGKPTPFQLKREESLKNKNLRFSKISIKNISEDYSYSNNRSDKATYLNHNKISLKYDQNISSFPKSNRLDRFFVLFKNSPNKRISTQTINDNREILDCEISNSNRKISTVLKFDLPKINTTSIKNSPRSSFISYKPRKKEKRCFSTNIEF